MCVNLTQSINHNGESEMITILLNGKKIKVEAGKTILEVANANGIEIPTLCHDEELKPFGSCWVCAVKVKNRRGFVTSCGTEVLDGMEIETDSEEVRNARKMALELLLSDHYADCEAPCKIACPNQVDIQSYVSLIANGEFGEAAKVIKETLPMPLSIGRVCPAFCEEECRRDIVDEPIAIRQLKRHAADYDLVNDWSYVPEKKAAKNKKVAIIGAGPSGLTCGYYLSNEGYDVKVFESAPKGGGWLRYGIPEYRLPKEILDAEIALMCKNGMEIEYNVEVGKDVSLSELSKNYDAIYLAIGAQKAVPMRIENSDLAGCYLGVDFLKDVVLEKNPEVAKNVAVVGGGNTAIDCARTAKRLGSDVTLIYRRTRKEMPAEAYEVDAAEEEGIKFHFLTNPVKNIGKDGKLSKIVLEKMKLGEPDESGRRRPVATGETFEEYFGTVIAAISQKPEIQFLSQNENKIDGKELPLTRWDTIEADEETQFTGIANIFGGGDFRRGPATAIEAIADGRKAFQAIERFLDGMLVELPASKFDSKKEKKLKDVDPKEFAQYEKIARMIMPELDAAERATNFEEVETGFEDNDACAEAKRCLECGCHVNETCDLRKYSTDYKINPDIFSGDKNKHPIDHSHPFIQRDANKCINCGRCVRICAEIQGPGVLGYIYRGFVTYVAPEFDGSLTKTACESCGKCIEACPVGALLPKNYNFKLNPRISKITTQNCGLCGTGCEIDVNTQSGRVTVINPVENESFNERNLCFAGKFGWQIFGQTDRILEPLSKTENGYEKCEDISVILSEIKEKVANAKSKKIYISPSVSLEEMLVMKQVAKNIGAEISSLLYRENFTDKIAKTKTYNDIKKAEVIVLVGKISHTLKILARNEQRSGKKLFIFTDKKSEFNNFADELFALSELKDFNANLAKTLFIYDRHNLTEKTIWQTWKKATEICDFAEGSGVLETTSYANFKGLQALNIAEGVEEKIDLGIYYGENHSQNNAKFSVMFNSHLGENETANFVLPKPTYLEMDGTTIANDGRICEFKNPQKSAMFSEMLETLKIAGLLGNSDEEIWLEKAKHISILQGEEMSKNELTKYLNSIENLQTEKFKKVTVQRKLIANLKESTKK